VYLEGELGAGKTTLARGFLHGMGHQGQVPSPTYTLIEPYDLVEYMVYHIDLYRIRSAEELDDLGLADELGTGSIALIEWPDHGARHLPPADLAVQLVILPSGRGVSLEAGTVMGQRVENRLLSSRQYG
jgi:tRNA threonylcarbamoyladenosine biosynthesis protein TsaE